MKTVITRKMLIDLLSAESGYYKYNIKELLYALDRVIYQCFNELEDDNDEVVIQLLDNMKLYGKVVPERNRKDPRNQEDITVGQTVKPRAIFSEHFRETIQEQFDNKQKDDE